MISKSAQKMIDDLKKTIDHPQKSHHNERLRVGLDLGTAYIVLVVLGEDNRPLYCQMQFANVVKDGLVVDFVGASKIVSSFKAEAEKAIGAPLSYTSIAVPPGTSEGDQRPFKYVAEGAGLEIVSIIDEPTAANAVLEVSDGAVVDIGGGTTGISIFENGKVVHIADEATGGTHVSLVIAGNQKISFEEAESLKKIEKNHPSLLPAIRPVFEKMGSIINKSIAGRDVKEIYLVGGTSAMQNIENVIKDITGLCVFKPSSPLLVTPLGIALLCRN